MTASVRQVKGQMSSREKGRRKRKGKEEERTRKPAQLYTKLASFSHQKKANCLAEGTEVERRKETEEKKREKSVGKSGKLEDEKEE